MVFARLLLAFAGLLIVQTGAPVRAADEAAVEIDHRFGTTRISGTPERVVSLSFIGHDFLLALGIEPVALRDWYGGHPRGVWPWAEAALGNSNPEVMRGGIDVERIARLKPDLIVGQASGIGANDYRILSKIAPTIAPQAVYGDYGTPWRVMLRRLGTATGRAERAEEVIAGIDAKIEAIRSRHPEWQGLTASIVLAGELGAYASGDNRGRLLSELGFRIPDAIEALQIGGSFYVDLSEEDLSPIDTDVLIWLDPGGAAGHIRDLPLRKTLRAFAQGREVYADPLLTGALSHSSPLSLAYALDRLVPLLEQAVDGDSRTPVESSAEAGLSP